MKRVALALVVTATLARADDDQAFRAAAELAARRDPTAHDAFEEIGRARPVSRWTDDAWVEAARVAEQRSELDRAKRDLAEAIAISSDAQLVRRAKRDLARLVAITGEGGEWTTAAAEHQRLVTVLGAGGDPTPALEALEALARAHPAYPRGVALRITIARGWEQEDEVARALGWLRDALAIGSDVDRARIELVRMAIRVRELAVARAELPQITDAGTRASLARQLAAAHTWQRFAWGAGALLLVLAGVAIALVRRRSTSWRAALRRVARPPTEVLYVAPVSAVVVAIAHTGNPRVAKAVTAIFVGATLVAWLSGVTLDAATRLSRRQIAAHALVVMVAALAVIYLALDHARLLDLVLQTWRTGPGK
ncbi:MAG TPA: hypothetical protein VK427_06345 [Kofleriaceae bacterium]|nr:hypothetical protein [Kofleriaceae bacterium]